MTTSIDVYIGSPLEQQSERSFLNHICDDLRQANCAAIILANFTPPTRPRQIDFFVVTERCAALIELKAFNQPVEGEINGEWALVLPDGSRKKLLLPNPHTQAVQCKYALSDEVRKLSAKHPDQWLIPGNDYFYQSVEGIVCIYPEIPMGSTVTEGNFKAKVVGYRECLKTLTLTGSRSPNWNKKQWQALVMYLALTKWEKDSQLRDTTADEALSSVSSYVERFYDFWRPRIGKLVPLTLRGTDRTCKTTEVIGIISEGKHYQIIGPSGSGKTELLLHIALQSLANGIVIIFVQVKNYDGDLSHLLDVSVSYLHPGNFADLMHRCKTLNKRTALLVDAFNECPHDKKDRFLQELQSLVLKEPLPVIITAQSQLQLPQHLRGETLTFADLSLEERKAVFEAHSGDFHGDVASLLQPFKTPLELSLAGQCLSDSMASVPHMTKADLLETYTRRLTERTGEPLRVRELFMRMAEAMADQFTYSLPLREIEQIASTISDHPSSSIDLLTSALQSNLVEVRYNRGSFRHEQFQLYFEAEAFLRHNPERQLLPSNLARPRHRHLSDLVIPMISDDTVLRNTLVALEDVETVLACLRGIWGPLARSLALKDAEQVLHACFINAMEFRARIEDQDDKTLLLVSGRRTLSSYDMVLLSAVGQALYEDILLDETLSLIRRTDTNVDQIVKRWPPENRKHREQWFAEMYVVQHPGSTAAWPTSLIATSCHNSWNSQLVLPVLPKISRILEGSERPTPGELYVCCLLLRRWHWKGEPPSYLPKLLRLSWCTELYHLQLQALQFVQGCAHETIGPLRDEIVEVLSGFETNNLFLNTQLVETSMAYDLIEPTVDAESAAKEIDEIITAVDTQQAREWAYSAISKQFEDVFQGAYYTAIRELSKDDLVTLYTRGSLGAPSYGFACDYILEELITLRDARASPAFERWATEIDVESMNIQETARVFALAQCGCAIFRPFPAQLANLDSDAKRAWQLYGEILFWGNKSTLSHEDILAKCTPLWEKLRKEIPFEAIDPLMHLWNAGPSLDMKLPIKGLRELAADFQDIVQSLLEFGLVNRERLITIFERSASFQKNRRTMFLIELLGELGTLSSIKVLETLTETPDYGQTSVEAIRSIRKRGE
ncbi:MAG: NERD domain-containing protein [Nitrospira sp.]|nr:NERD domain-containing protein [Nitrospira sp.]